MATRDEETISIDETIFDDILPFTDTCNVSQRYIKTPRVVTVARCGWYGRTKI
jgi:hypothetical protein